MRDVDIKRAMLCLLWTLCAGCSGTLYTSNEAIFRDGKVKGVIFYPHIAVVERTRTTVTIDDKGVVVADHRGANGLSMCDEIITEKVVVVPDYAAPQRVYYEPGLFESVKFGVTLDPSGLLTGVNSEGTLPDIASLVATAAGAAGLSAPAAPAGQMTMALPRAPAQPAHIACNSGVEVIARRPIQP